MIEKSLSQAVKLYTNPFYKSQTIFIDDKLVSIQMHIKKIYFNKPIYTGFAILELSKLLMYDAFYNIILKKWPDAELVGFDTDGFFIAIYDAKDIYKDMNEMREFLDTSDYPSISNLEKNYKFTKDKLDHEMSFAKEEFDYERSLLKEPHENDYENNSAYLHALDKYENSLCSNLLVEYDEDLYDAAKELEHWKKVKEIPKDIRNLLLDLYNETNKKVIGKFKDELCRKIMSEIVFMRSKQHGHIENENEHIKCKGISRSVTKNNIKFREMKNCVLNIHAKDVFKDMVTLNNKGQNMYKIKTTKKALTSNDDKRFICINGIYTFPFNIRSVAHRIMYHGRTIKEWMEDI